MDNRQIQNQFHKTLLTDPQFNFDYRETTISHLFRYPHPALGNRSYGGQLFKRLLDLRLIHHPLKIFEIGGGLGWLAKGFLDEVKEKKPNLYSKCSYTIFDLSPELISFQKRLLKEHKDKIKWIKGHAEKLPLKAKSFKGIIICNEVIADLETVELDQIVPDKKAGLKKAHKEAIKYINKYKFLGKKVPSKNFQLNLGAIKFLEEVSRVLAKKGAALITEYGGNFPSKLVKLTDPSGTQVHVEYSIRFDHLKKIAIKSRLKSQVTPLINFMKFKKGIRVASYTDVQKLHFIDPNIEIYAYPLKEIKKRFDLLPKFFEFRFPRIDSKYFPDEKEQTGFSKAFQAMILRK